MNQNKGLLLILATAFISGISIFVNKFGVSLINPYIFTGLKNIIVALLVVSWLLTMKDWQLIKKLRKKQWLILLGIGLLGGSIPFLLFFKGLSLTNPAQASFLHKTMFIYVAVLAVIFLKEKINKSFLIGGLCLVLGNLFLLKLIPTQLGVGDGLIFLATLFWAGENILSKRALQDLPSRIIIWGRMFFGSLFIIVFWLITQPIHLIASLSITQIGWLMITSVFLFSYLVTWYTGLKYVKVSVAATILLLGSPITTWLSFFFLHHSLTLIQGIGTIFIILGIVLVIGVKSLSKAYVWS